MRPQSIQTIESFIIEQERLHADASGELTNLLYDMALAGKIISSYVRRAGLSDVIGTAGATNVQGEEQQRLDVLANEVIQEVVVKAGRVCIVASEENEDPVPTPADRNPGKYVLLYDPLDGSSNIDVNASIGTIFSIHKRVTPEGKPGTLADCLQSGRNQVAAGYIIYGSSTVMVYSAGNGVHAFTLDPRIGEFLLSHENFQTPSTGAFYSINESHFDKWSEGYREVVREFKGRKGPSKWNKNARYIGTLVADFHRNLLKGGVFMYPGDPKNPDGKLRLLYECAPMAFIAEAAGGRASNGSTPILDIMPTKLHQRAPLLIGSRDDVAFVEETLKRVDG